jgi:hypothetical protein
MDSPAKAEKPDIREELMNEIQPTIPIWRTSVAAYRLGLGAVFRDWVVFRYFIYASALTFVLMGVQIYQTGAYDLSSVERLSASDPMLTLAFDFLLYLLYAVAITPFAIAVYRKILLAESPRSPYLLATISPAHRRFALSTIVVYGAFFVASLAGHPFIYIWYDVNPFDSAALVSVMTAQPALALFVSVVPWVGFAIAGLIAARFTFMFPAIATGISDYSLRRCLRDGRGSTWRLFFVFVLIFALPFVLLVVAFATASVIFVIGHPELFTLPDQASDGMMWSPPFLAVYAVMFVGLMLLVAVVAAAAARAFEIKVNRGMSGVADVFA